MTYRLPLLFTVSIALIACNSSSKTATTVTDLDQDNKTTLIKGMATLDQPYVSSLFYSNMKASKPLFNDAKQTIGRLNKQWGDFKSSHNNTFDTTDWNDGFTRIDDDLATANSHYETINSFPANLTTAHLALEDVREKMKNMRSKVGLTTYLMDNVTNTHHKMEPITKGYAAYKASNNTDAINVLKEALRTHLPPFAEALKALNRQYGDGSNTANLYELSANKSAKLSNNISNTDPKKPGLVQIVDALKKELAADNNPKVVQLSSKIKGKFVSIFLSFGDFVTPFKQDFITVQQSIIPMLYCTGNPPDAGSACLNSNTNPKQGTLAYVNASSTALKKLKAHFPSNENTKVPKLLGWENILVDIDKNLAYASNTLEQATDLEVAKNSGAHLNAESVRDNFYSLVAAYEGEVTVMTRMDEYHAEFEKVQILVKDGNVNDTDIDTIKLQLPKLQIAFDNLSSQVSSADKDLWGVADVNLDNLLLIQQNNIKSLSVEVANFESEKNSNIIVQKSKALKGLYIPLFKAFGAF